uniref:Uncharacterized protein n=1 Tax=Tanacetum cinerariifolium TaxID=118510 RepID=A0A699WE22_TANCI|nr:hypothetical protein [Tanacetum cinerariifolium]
MQDKEECVLEDMEEEYNSEIWPKLKQNVVDIMESGWGMAAEMRSEGDTVEARTSDMGGALFNDDISNV